MAVTWSSSWVSVAIQMQSLHLALILPSRSRNQGKDFLSLRVPGLSGGKNEPSPELNQGYMFKDTERIRLPATVSALDLPTLLPLLTQNGEPQLMRSRARLGPRTRLLQPGLCM